MLLRELFTANSTMQPSEELLVFFGQFFEPSSAADISDYNFTANSMNYFCYKRLFSQSLIIEAFYR
jgi:hypothetical protein